MKELYQIAAEYYINLESFSAYGGFKSFYTWIFLISSTMFVVCFILFVITVSKENIPINFWFGVTIAVELFALFFHDKMTSKRNAIFKEYVAGKTDEHIASNADLDALKPVLLENLLNCKQIEFYEVTQKLGKMLHIENKISGKRSMIDAFFSFIYEESANQRVLALFIVLSSIITILAVNSGQSIEDVFAIIDSKEFWAAYGIYLVILVSVYVILKKSYIFLKRVAIFISLLFYRKGTKIQNLNTVKYLIADLNYYNAFERDEERKIIIISK